MSYKVYELITVADSQENINKLADLLEKGIKKNESLHINPCNCFLIEAGLASEDELVDELKREQEIPVSQWKGTHYFCDYYIKERGERNGYSTITIDACGRYTNSPLVFDIHTLFPDAFIEGSILDEAEFYNEDDYEPSHYTNDKEGKVFPKLAVFAKNKKNEVVEIISANFPFDFAHKLNALRSFPDERKKQIFKRLNAWEIERQYHDFTRKQ